MRRRRSLPPERSVARGLQRLAVARQPATAEVGGVRVGQRELVEECAVDLVEGVGVGALALAVLRRGAGGFPAAATRRPGTEPVEVDGVAVLVGFLGFGALAAPAAEAHLAVRAHL